MVVTSLGLLFLHGGALIGIAWWCPHWDDLMNLHLPQGWPMATDIAHFGEDEVAEGMSSQTRSKNQQRENSKKDKEGLVVPPL